MLRSAAMPEAATREKTPPETRRETMSESTETALEDRLRELIVERLKLEIEPASIAAEQPLFGDDGLGLDSIDALELVLGIEQEFGVQIEDEEMGSQALSSVSALADFVREKSDGKVAANTAAEAD